MADIESDDLSDYPASFQTQAPPRRIEDPEQIQFDSDTLEQNYLDVAATPNAIAGSDGGQGSQGQQGSDGPPVSTNTFVARAVVIVGGLPTTATVTFYTP